MAITIGVVRETVPGERRVALTPDVAKKLKAKAVNLLIERGAGDAASFPDAAYKDVEVAADARSALGRADVLLTVQPPTLEEIAALKEGAVTIGYLSPHLAPERIKALRDRKITSFAMELLPRTTRAQAMDVLSSQANIAGYKAVLIAAEASPKFFPMLTTAAGTVRPSKVLIIGAGVAGLQAIATARRLGGQVEGLRCAPGNQGTDPVAGRKVRRAGRQRRRRRWLRTRIDCRRARAAAGCARRAYQGHRCDRDDGGRAGPQGAAHHHPGDGRGHEAWFR